MSYVLENLYLGSVDDACATSRLKQYNITHILTVDCKPLAIEKRSDFEYKYVHALDMEDTDILSRLQECLDFIDTARQSGAVLVHCYAGQSRSATVVQAYMMQKLDMAQIDASKTLKKLKPDVNPNSGFQEQLELFEAMGNKVDLNSSIYKMYRLAILAQKVQAAQMCEALPADSFAADPTTAGAHTTGAVYKCRKCRRALFRQSAVLPHMTGQGEVAFTWRKHADTDATENTPCQVQIFVEPVEWMAEDVLQIEGKLSCPKCHSKLGSFRWTGERCPCGTWITPAFHIQSNKVDVMQPRITVPIRGQQGAGRGTQGVGRGPQGGLVETVMKGISTQEQNSGTPQIRPLTEKMEET